MSEHLPAIIVAAPLVAALAAPLAALRSARWARACALLGQLAALAASGAALERVLRSGPWRYAFGAWAPPWGIEHSVDGLSAGLAVLFSALAALTSLYGWHHEEEDPPVREGALQGMLLLLLSGCLGIALTADLFNLYVFLEIASLSSYSAVAAGSGRDAAKAAFQYLLLGSAGASFWVLGLGLLYSASGTLNLPHLAALWPALAARPEAAAGLALMAAGLALKLPVFPLNAWQADAYAAAPARAMPLLSALLSTALAMALLRLLNLGLGGSGAAGPVLAVLGWAGIVTVLVASAAAFGQSDARRMLAWSSAGQLGYVLIGLALGTRSALAGAVWYAAAHSVLKCCLFMVAGEVGRGGRCDVDDFRGLSRSRPAAAAGLAVAGLALAGAPPAAPFFGKWALLQGAFQSGAWVSAAALSASSLLTALYVFRLIGKAYLEQPASGAAGRSGWAPVCILAAAAAGVLLGLFHQPLMAALVEPAL